MRDGVQGCVHALAYCKGQPRLIRPRASLERCRSVPAINAPSDAEADFLTNPLGKSESTGGEPAGTTLQCGHLAGRLWSSRWNRLVIAVNDIDDRPAYHAGLGFRV